MNITNVPMQKGFMYLTAVIDVFSRFIVGWCLSNTLAAAASLQVLKEAVAEHGKPDILNRDQVSVYLQGVCGVSRVNSSGSAWSAKAGHRITYVWKGFDVRSNTSILTCIRLRVVLLSARE